jgi:hypothetical protein
MSSRKQPAVNGRSVQNSAQASPKTTGFRIMFEETAGDLAELDAESPDQYSPAIRHRPDTSGAGPWPAKLLTQS